MNKLILLLLMSFALGCGSDDRTSARDMETQERNAGDADDPDAPSVHADTTTSGGMNRQNPYDTLR